MLRPFHLVQVSSEFHMAHWALDTSPWVHLLQIPQLLVAQNEPFISPSFLPTLTVQTPLLTLVLQPGIQELFLLFTSNQWSILPILPPKYLSISVSLHLHCHLLVQATSPGLG